MNTRVFRDVGRAMSNKRYRLGINILENERRRRTLSEGEEYLRALLYDHLAARLRTNTDLRRRYLNIALAMYRSILGRNPRYFHALLRIGKIWEIRGHFKKALSYQTKAYRLMLKLPRADRGALAIGSTYEAMGNLRQAERWYKREAQAMLPDDFGTIANLLQFYLRVGKQRSALRLAPKLRILLRKEYSKQLYRGLGMRRSKYFRTIRAALEKAEAHPPLYTIRRRS